MVLQINVSVWLFKKYSQQHGGSICVYSTILLAPRINTTNVRNRLILWSGGSPGRKMAVCLLLALAEALQGMFWMPVNKYTSHRVEIYMQLETTSCRWIDTILRLLQGCLFLHMSVNFSSFAPPFFVFLAQDRGKTLRRFFFFSFWSDHMQTISESWNVLCSANTSRTNSNRCQLFVKQCGNFCCCSSLSDVDRILYSFANA